MTKPVRLAYCEVGKHLVARADLVRRPVKYRMPIGMQNLLTQSGYTDNTTWVMSPAVPGTYVGLESLGVHPDPRWTIFDENYNPTIRLGCPTFQGVVLPYYQPGITFDPAVERYCFAVKIGPWEQAPIPELTVEIGLYVPVGAIQVRQPWHRKISCITQVWHCWENDATFAGKLVQPYLKVTPTSATGRWWFEEAQLEADVERPGHHLPTEGTAYTSWGGDMTGYAAVCPQCIEDIPDFIDWHPIEIPHPRYEGLDDILPEE